MAYTKTVFRIILSSPSDLEKERAIVKAIVEEINETNKMAPIFLQLFMWENDVAPLTNMKSGQYRIDEIFNIEESDMVIGIFNKRIGQPVMGDPSGTDHEIQLAINSFVKCKSPDIMLYFKRNLTKIDDMSDKELEDYKIMKARKENYCKLGIVQNYNSSSQFEKNIRKHITQFFMKKLAENQKSFLGQRVLIKTRKEFERMEDIVSCAKEDIYILGINLEGALNIRESLIKKAHEGIKVRLLALDPYGTAVEYFNINDVELSQRRGKIVENLKIFKPIIGENFEIRVTDRIFIAGCTAIDCCSDNGRIIAQHYLNSTSTSEAPTLDLYAKDTPDWINVYKNYLEILWNKYSKDIRGLFNV